MHGCVRDCEEICVGMHGCVDVCGCVCVCMDVDVHRCVQVCTREVKIICGIPVSSYI